MLTAFTASLLLITISELGDKTFFIAAILAMRHSRRWVFVGAASALATMTVLSVLMGQAATFLPPQVLKWAEVGLFFLFGVKLLYEASQMPAVSDHEEEKEAAEAVARAERGFAKRHRKEAPLAVMSEAFGLTFVTKWGDSPSRRDFVNVLRSPPLRWQLPVRP